MKIISHRGAKGLAPEHTIPSFEAALAADVDEIEFDIRISSDGIAILEHDNTLEASNGKNYEVSSYTLAELRSFKDDLMTLEETLQLIRKRCVAHIEVKPGEAVEPVLRTVQSFIDRGWPVELFIISSRDFKLLRQVKKLAPHIPLSIIQPWSGVLAVWYARRLGTKRISMNEHVMWPGFIRSMSRRGWLLSGYAMNDLPRAKRWEKYGLYAIITDYPDRFTSLNSR